MAEIRATETSESSFKIRIPLNLADFTDLSINKSQLNQLAIRIQKIYPVFLKLDRTLEGFQISDKRKIKLESKSITKSKPKPKPTEFHKCDIDSCDKKFSDLNQLKKHQSTHIEKQHFCPVENCGRQFLDNSKLRRHMLVHTGEKPFKCEFCSKCFSLDFNLKTHLRIHTGEKPYQCSFAGCTKRFTQSSNLAAHERIHFMTDDEIKTRTPRQTEYEKVSSQSGHRQAFSLEPQPFEYFNFSSLITTPALPIISNFVSASALPTEENNI